MLAASKEVGPRTEAWTSIGWTDNTLEYYAEINAIRNKIWDWDILGTVI